MAIMVGLLTTTRWCWHKFAIMVGAFSTSLPFGNFNLLNLNEHEASCNFDVQPCGVCWESELVWGEEKFNFRFIELETSMRH